MTRWSAYTGLTSPQSAVKAAVTRPPDIRRAATKDSAASRRSSTVRPAIGLRSHDTSRVASRTMRAATTALDSWSASVVLRSAESTMAPARWTSRARGAYSLKRAASPAATQSWSEPSAF